MIQDAILTGSPWVTAIAQVAVAAGTGILAAAVILARRTRRCPNCGATAGRHAGRRTTMPGPQVPTTAQQYTGQVYLSDQTRLMDAVRGDR
ncbi:hypothetical protein [Rhizomonospora bruguierae]|uniref:hypothetical protein n=1 Tax=Rhizomonospora bruguierae TaxID=1581705 RepID=UPI001BCFE206|nr:hypothetical protein [Micromonospora sp. NBRC 107566]